MTKYEFIQQNHAVLKECQRLGISVSDARSADIYTAVQHLKQGGNKMEYCVNRAGEIFGVSAATVWRVLRDMDSTLTA